MPNSLDLINKYRELMKYPGGIGKQKEQYGWLEQTVDVVGQAIGDPSFKKKFEGVKGEVVKFYKKRMLEEKELYDASVLVNKAHAQKFLVEQPAYDPETKEPLITKQQYGEARQKQVRYMYDVVEQSYLIQAVGQGLKLAGKKFTDWLTTEKVSRDRLNEILLKVIKKEKISGTEKGIWDSFNRVGEFRRAFLTGAKKGTLKYSPTKGMFIPKTPYYSKGISPFKGIEKGLPRPEITPKTTVTKVPKAQYPITPTGKLAPQVAGVTKPLVPTEPSTAGVPTFLSPKTQEIMAMEKLRTVGGYPQYPPPAPPLPKKELLMTRPEVRIHKPKSAKTLIEKYRDVHKGEEPPLLDEAEIAREVEQVLAEPMVVPSKQTLAGTGVERPEPQLTQVSGYGLPTRRIAYPGEELARGGLPAQPPTAVAPRETRISPLITTGVTPQVTKVGFTKVPAYEPRPSVRTGTPMEATSNQVKEIIKVARKKLLIRGEKIGKGFIRLAQNMTGKSRVSKMTQKEAETFIDALKGMSLPKIYRGKMSPPPVPTSKKIVPQEFFRSFKFKTPTIMKLLTSQTYYTQKLGIKKITEQLERGKMRVDLDKARINREIDRQINKINKMAKGFFPRVVEKIGKKIVKKPTNAVAMWRHILSVSEKPPAKLPDGTMMTNEMVKTFDFFRRLTQSFYEDMNSVYLAMGEEPIGYVKGYVKRVAGEMAQEMLQETYPFPEQLKYWSKEVVGKRIFDASKLHRKLAVDLEELWTRDLAHAMKSMVHVGLKVIHLNHPLQAYNEQMGVLAKDKAVYKDQPPEQKKIYDEFHTMPARTRKWADNFINEVIKGQMPLVGEEVNQLVTGGPLKTLFNKILNPFGRAIGRDPITKVFQMGGRMMIHGVMGPVRPKQLIRNKFQLVQNIALYGLNPTLKGLLPSNPTLKGLLDASLFLQSYTGLEELPQGIMSKAEALNLKAFQWTAVSNARQAMKAAYHNRMKYFNDPKYKKYGYVDPKRTYQESKDFLYDSEKDKMLAKIEWGAGVTQYHYIAMGMPQVFRYKVGVPATRLQSWWMNHFFKFQREAWSTSLRGVDGQGDKVAPIDRINLYKYLILGGGLLAALGYERSYTYGALPTNLPPTGQFMLGAYKWVTNQGVLGRDTKWKKRNRKQAEYLMFSALQAHIPGYLLMKDIKAVWEGKKPIESLFMYMHKIKGKWGIGYIPEIKKGLGISEEKKKREKAKQPPPKSKAQQLIEMYRNQ